MSGPLAQAVINLGGTVAFFINNTFNYPTLAEAYRIAGLDAWNRMGRGWIRLVASRDRSIGAPHRPAPGQLRIQSPVTSQRSLGLKRLIPVASFSVSAPRSA